MYKPGFQCQIPPMLDMYMDIFGYTSDGYFVEVGAFDCYTWSNTWPLAQAGWHGVYYEPQPDLESKCHELYKDNKNITIRRKALSNMPGVATFYLGGSLSTLSKKTRDMYLTIPWAKSTGHGENITIQVEVNTLDNELAELDWPVGFDVLVVDVEGSEMDVLNGFNVTAWQPRMCIVETHDEISDGNLSDKATIIDTYFDIAEYNKIYSDTINSIYTRKGEKKWVRRKKSQ